jgi:hypothetical protein
MSADADGRRARLAAALWLLCAFLVWHGRFDRDVEIAVGRYLVAQHQHVLGHGPFIPINAAMRPAVSAASLDATRWSATVAVAGLSATVLAARRSRGVKGLP